MQLPQKRWPQPHMGLEKHGALWWQFWRQIPPIYLWVREVGYKNNTKPFSQGLPWPLESRPWGRKLTLGDKLEFLSSYEEARNSDTKSINGKHEAVCMSGEGRTASFRLSVGFMDSWRWWHLRFVVLCNEIFFVTGSEREWEVKPTAQLSCTGLKGANKLHSILIGNLTFKGNFSSRTWKYQSWSLCAIILQSKGK